MMLWKKNVSSTKKSFALLIVTSFFVTGCMTSERQEQLQASIKQLQKKISALETQINNKTLTSQDNLEDVQNQLKLTQGAVDEYKERLKHIEETSQSNTGQKDQLPVSSDVFVQMQRQIAMLELVNYARLTAPRKGKLHSKLKSLASIEKVLKADLQRREYGKVINLATSVLTAADANEKMLQVALEYRAEARYSAKNYRGAALDFSTYLDTFPNASKRARALLLDGDSYIYLKNNAVAKTYYQECAEDYAKTAEGKAAAERLASLNSQTKESK